MKKQKHLKTAHQRRVEEFMLLAAQNVGSRPALPTQNERVLRAQLILEEALETIEALGVEVELHVRDMANVADYLRMTLNTETKKTFTALSDEDASLIDIADGCADLSVVTIGTLSACGIPDKPLLRLVDQNNLDKFGPGHSYSETGKLIKPPGHRPPDIDTLLTLLRYAVLKENE